MDSQIVSSILSFWFDSSNSKKWFDKDPIFDKIVFDTFNSHLVLMRNKINSNSVNLDITNLDITNLDTKLSLIILFDQLSRNIQRLTKNTSHRNSDDEFAINLSLDIITTTNILTLKQEYFYFVILPLRHSLNRIHCEKAIELVNSYNNIHNQSEWFRFKLQSYRSFYNSTSHEPIGTLRNFDLQEFKKKINPYIEYLDDRSLNLDNFTQDASDDDLIVKYILKSIYSMNLQNIQDRQERQNRQNIQNTYCVSLSGGVDSMVIAHALKYIGSKLNFKVAAVHIQHSNRPEAQFESELIEEYCSQLGIQFHKIIIEHIKRHEIKRETYELETRNIRFDFYRNMKKHFRVEYFALGHHKGDLAENVLTNLLKGRSLLDLPVMSEFDEQEGVTLWRPLLYLPKSEIIDYATKYGIIYTKNSTPEWSVRGKLRNHVIPMLNSMFNSVEDNLYKAGIESKELSTHFNGIIDKIYSKVTFGKLGFYLDIIELESAPLSVWKQLFQKIMFKVNSKIIAEHVLLELKKFDKKIITANKDYVSSFNGEKLIFYNSKYFNFNYNSNRIVYEITKNPSNKNVIFTLDDFIAGKFSYTIRSNVNVNFNQDKSDKSDKVFISKSLEKHAKQQINDVISGQILNKYSWIDMKCSQQKEIFHYIVNMEYQ